MVLGYNTLVDFVKELRLIMIGNPFTVGVVL